MSTFLSVVLLRGRLTRLPYALVAVPMLAIFFCGRDIAYLAPLVMLRLGGHLQDMGLLMPLFMALNLAILPVFIASFNRLHDLGLTGWLALPVTAPLLFRFYVKWMMSGDGALQTNGLIMMWLYYGATWLTILIVVVLALVPGRKVPTSVVRA
ncbi:MAG: hypothetical protein QM647_13405 [Asticcacaulis sp.]|uniref:DUF805 domain-containing protein n=1 Tax=Asticcacaulis sp. TaxID=1872648 RepID=UPI0039E427E3